MEVGEMLKLVEFIINEERERKYLMRGWFILVQVIELLGWILNFILVIINQIKYILFGTLKCE